MKVQLQSTTKVVEVNGVKARIWEGVTESGIEVHAFIVRVAVHKNQDCSQFETELLETEPPKNPDINGYPARLVI